MPTRGYLLTLTLLTLPASDGSAWAQPIAVESRSNAPAALPPQSSARPLAPRPQQFPMPREPLPTRPTTPPWMTQPENLRPAPVVQASNTVPADAPESTRVDLITTEPAKTPIGDRTPIQRTDAGSTSAAGQTIWSAVLGLVIAGVVVVGLARMLRKRLPASLAPLPREACEVLGRRRLDARTQLTLVRLDSRVLVLGLGPDGVRTLAELDDPTEIDRLTGLCRLSQPSGPTGGAFASMLARQSTSKRAVAPSSVPLSPDAPADLNRDNFPIPTAASSGTAGNARGRLRPRLDVTTP